ncbi:hypothetical protein COO91_03626 [Nostoc flagelliforme CCNUN1]|uniref:Uncharacterized protein n=1 Tax=Nostoc flagelliforme CCNUN1 TaxID=2038116 RepID=A0A2K8SQQ4_9NOSO|nr:hypothetical protein COO91_03626 [Nostoc flagelliforme CCNUN1]
MQCALKLIEQVLGRVFKVLDPPQPPLKRGAKSLLKSPFLRGI